MLMTPSAIVTSRKRKLRELFAVASQVDPLPDDGFANPDAPAATPAEWQFLQASDIVQYVSRTRFRPRIPFPSHTWPPASGFLAANAFRNSIHSRWNPPLIV